MKRGTGITTGQMTDAPIGSVYIWVNDRLDYPKRLAEQLGRRDLRIESPSWLTSDRFRGCRFPTIILDHAAMLSDNEWAGLSRARSVTRKNYEEPTP